MVSAERRRIVKFATDNRLPTVAPASVLLAREGVLITYGYNVDELVRRTATLVDRILKGVRPADLPVEQPTKLELVVNMRTAKTLGLTIPPSMLQRADQVIR